VHLLAKVSCYCVPNFIAVDLKLQKIFKILWLILEDTAGYVMCQVKLNCTLSCQISMYHVRNAECIPVTW